VKLFPFLEVAGVMETICKKFLIFIIKRLEIIKLISYRAFGFKYLEFLLIQDESLENFFDMCNKIISKKKILLDVCTETSLKKELGANVPHLTKTENLY